MALVNARNVAALHRALGQARAPGGRVELGTRRLAPEEHERGGVCADSCGGRRFQETMP
jgi:hypothetical protein